MYGGDLESGTIYCCPGEGRKDAKKGNLEVEGIQVPLSKDSVLRQFLTMLKKKSPTKVRATLVGVFFSGEKREYKGHTYWEGYGHMGCCSLLAIQRVQSVEPFANSAP